MVKYYFLIKNKLKMIKQISHYIHNIYYIKEIILNINIVSKVLDNIIINIYLNFS